MGRINRGTTQIPALFIEQTLIRRNVPLRPELLNRMISAFAGLSHDGRSFGRLRWEFRVII